jgi:signal transduction histidine kinase
MADKVQNLVRGQQALLANVSHELRTPIARMRVLVELLEDRLEMMSKHVGDDGKSHLDRVRSGLGDMNIDTQEIERLISDLLTSGRLELRVGDRAGLETGPVDIGQLATRMADRVSAEVIAPDPIVVDADEMLLERLLSNLLANARRACPEGALTVEVSRQGDLVQIAVEDEGSGIPVEDRDEIFEPFRRLDAARSRDKGGVGLGLYLCRQIARAHGGDIVAADRADGRSGARMVVTLRG